MKCILQFEIQIRVDNASSVREDSRSGSNRTLTNSIQANLMKLSRGVSRERERER